MAFPVILIDSVLPGSDSLASGAGPGTALTGTLGRTRNTASQLRVGLFEASPPDLSGVAVDGTHVLFINISTAGQRNFSSISAKKDTQQTTIGDMTATSAVLSATVTTGMTAGDVISVAGAGAAGVTLYSTILTVDSGVQATLNDNASTTVVAAAVVDPKQVSLTASQGLNTGATNTAWAIGGRRASLGATTTKKLLENNAANGDAMAGWIMELQSAHSESVTAQFVSRRAGDATDGKITVRGVAGGTRPLINTNQNAIFWNLAGAQAAWTWQFIEFRNTAVVKTASVGFSSGGTMCENTFRDIKMSHISSFFWKCFDLSGASVIESCELTAGNNVITISSSDGGDLILNNYLFDSEFGTGIVQTSDAISHVIISGNVITNMGVNGIHCSSVGASSANVGGPIIVGNTISECIGDGIKIAANSANVRRFVETFIANNILSTIGGYGINFSGTGITLPLLQFYNVQFRNNNTFANTTGRIFPTALVDLLEGDPQLDPTFTGGTNFSVGTNMKEMGYPETNIGTGSTTRSFVDIGAAQRVEPAAGAGGGKKGSAGRRTFG